MASNDRPEGGLRQAFLRDLPASLPVLVGPPVAWYGFEFTDWGIAVSVGNAVLAMFVAFVIGSVWMVQRNRVEDTQL